MLNTSVRFIGHLTADTNTQRSTIEVTMRVGDKFLADRGRPSHLSRSPSSRGEE